MVSPSISSTIRITPCAAGCCGPKFIVKLRICGAPSSSSPRSVRGGGAGSLMARLTLFQLRRRWLSRRPAGPGPPFPRRQEVEAAEFLLQFDRLVDDALLVLVVAQFDIAGEREVLAQRVPVEPVIGQDAAQVGMVAETDAVKVPCLALPPAGGAEYADRGWHGLLLVGLQLHADAQIVAHAEEIIDHVEAQRPVRIVDAANVAEHGEAALRIVAQKTQHLEHRLTRYLDRQLAVMDIPALHHPRQGRREVFG